MEAKTINVKVAIGIRANGQHVAEVVWPSGDARHELNFVRGYRDVIYAALIEADIPITEPVTIKAEVVR